MVSPRFNNRKYNRARTSLAIWGPVLLICAVGFALTWFFFVGSPLPTTITLGSGEAGGAYHAFGEKYREHLAKIGISVELVETAGSGENLQLLDAGKLDAAFVQSGLIGAGSFDPKKLEALCSLAREPLWLFYRSGETLSYLTDLVGRRIAAGEIGSGTRAVAMQFAEDNGLTHTRPPTNLLEIDGLKASDALQAGSVDAAFFVASIEAPYIRELIERSDLKLMSFVRAESYLRRHRFLTRTILPQGGVSLAQDIPSTAITLLAPTAMLVSTTDIHPDHIYLLIEAAKATHRPGNLLDKPGEFPSTRFVDLPMNDQAKRYLEKGPNWLHRALPFRAAAEIDRLKVLLLPLLSLLLPLVKVAPPLYRWRMRARVFRWYEQLREADLRSSRDASESDIPKARMLIDKIEADLVNVTVPLSYMAEFYNLRLHIGYLRKRLAERESGSRK